MGPMLALKRLISYHSEANKGFAMLSIICMNTNVEVAHMQDCQSLPKIYFKTEEEQGSP